MRKPRSRAARSNAALTSLSVSPLARWRVELSANSGSMPGEQPAIAPIVEFGAFEVVVALRRVAMPSRAGRLPSNAGKLPRSRAELDPRRRASRRGSRA